jgi:hypothetical protein
VCPRPAGAFHRAELGDGAVQLRYTAGPYAAELIANRAAADDTTFISGVKQRFGI